MSSPALRRMTVPGIAAYVANNQSRFNGELQAFVRIASISADPARTDDVKRCSRWLAAHLRRIGLQRVRMVPTKRHPIVYAEWTGAPGKPTVLIYGHYDVQPVGPVREWTFPAFGGRIHDGFVHGRGASDDKGQLFTHVVAGLHDRDGRVAIPGFYDRVRRWSHAEREYLARTGPSDQAVLHEAGTTAPWGEHGYSIYERLTLRPSLAVTGIQGGHTGAGPKGVIPGRALAKLSFRLVPDQEPAEIERLVRRFIARVAPPTVRATLRTHIRSRPALIDRKHPAMQAAATAYRRVFGRVPRWVRSGGSIPAVSEFTRVLDVPTVLMGFASPGDGLHGPNEKFSLKNFQRGILCSVAFLESLGRTSRNGRVIERAGQVVLNGY